MTSNSHNTTIMDKQLQRSTPFDSKNQDTGLHPMLTLKEVAFALRVCEKTVTRLHEAGKLPALKVGGQWRFRLDDVQALISTRNVAAALAAA